MSYYAHKAGQHYYLLSFHLAETAAGAAERLNAHPRREQLRTVALLAGWSHDFGKYTPFFQNYLRTGRGGPEKQHAFPSALWAAYLAEQFAMSPVDCLALFVSVSRHHRRLADPEEMLVAPRELNATSWDHLEPGKSERLQITRRQIDALCKDKEQAAIACSLQESAEHTKRLLRQKNLPLPVWLDGNWPRLLQGFLNNWIQSYGQLYRYRRHQKRDRDGTDMQGYFDLLALFSALIDADKIHAARLKETERTSLPRKPVKRYRKKQFGLPCTVVDRLRDDLYTTVNRTIEETPLSQKLLTITAPTGSGKTLAGLSAAFTLREKLYGLKGGSPRIVYALPFTSIVDQTFDTLQQVLVAARNTVTTGPPPSSWLLKHHHLAETTYCRKNDDAGSLSLDQALLLIESWQSEIIVTTFVQLLHTLIGSENRMLKKFHRLQNAILILDEVQNIPVEYWPLVEKVLREACKHLDTRILLMTATRPEWFDEGEALELAGPEERIRSRFAALDRVTIISNPDPLTVEELADQFQLNYDADRSYLVILNTIKSSIIFYRLLKEKIGGLSSLYYLSTNITPGERTRRLQQLRELLKNGNKPVLVSTQVVEAGVDLDFNEVWRDLGPIDAIVQAAGRCNRHFTRARGHVRVWHLVNRTEKGDTTLAQYVYGKIHTHTAKHMFEKTPLLQECNFYEAVNHYFETIRKTKSAAISKNLLEAMQHWRFSRRDRDSELLGVANFALIESRPHYINVFVEIDAKAIETWQLYQSAVVTEKDFEKRRQAYLSLKHNFSSYLLSIPARLVVRCLDDSTSPLYIPHGMLNEFYDPETGFSRIDDEKVVIF